MKYFIFLILIFSFSGVFAEVENVSRQDALDAIANAEGIVLELAQQDLPFEALNDGLIEARRVFQQVEYANILKGLVNATNEEKSTARSALSLIDWKNLSYANVLTYTDKIAKLREETFFVYDLMIVEEKKLETDLPNETVNLFFNARNSFYAGRLNEAQTFLEEFRESYESTVFTTYSVRSITLEAKDFIIRYWWQIIVAIFVLTVFYLFFRKRIMIALLKREIKKLHADKVALTSLIRTTQEERYKENSISALTYNIRVKKYHEKLQTIQQTIPVLETRLRKLS